MVKGSKNPRFGAPYAKFLDTGLDVRSLDLEIEIVNAYEPPESKLKRLHGTLYNCMPKKFEVSTRVAFWNPSHLRLACEFGTTLQKRVRWGSACCMLMESRLVG